MGGSPSPGELLGLSSQGVEAVATSDLVGLRIKTVRRQRGLSQAQLAHPELSDSYISLIESGKRTPTPSVLELLAQKLDCSLSYLLNGVTAEQMRDLELALGYADLALENGEAFEARVRFVELLADSNLTGLTALRQSAEFGLARAHEACGEQEEAIVIFRRLQGEQLSDEQQIELAKSLCRLYRVSGRLTESVEVAESTLASRSAWSDAYVELGATLLAAYWERGDLLRARQFVAELLDAAEALGSPRALVAANWNAAYTARRTGHGGEALNFAEKALAVQVENGPSRFSGAMHVTVANLYLRLRPEQTARAVEFLERAMQIFSESPATAFEQANARLERSRAEIMSGRLDTAISFAEEGLTLLPDSAQILATEAHLLKSRAYGLQNHAEEAARELDLARDVLVTMEKADIAVEYWYGAAETCELLGDTDGAVDAYQKALAAAGL
ncbi:helix-turn-helix domain-containing protein [Nonomuraea sp. NPDC050663]|uniref:helix-turn-helix domain-containing protein n=1 Tax=Nonomuraea sp. NPDC050663 TaxID=3364370 RepID=UPI0037A1C2F4